MPPKMTISPTMEELDRECNEYVRTHPDQFGIADELETLIVAQLLLFEKLGIVARTGEYRLSRAGKLQPVWRTLRKQ